MNATRERILVGLFVLVAGGLLIGTVLAMSGGLSGSRVPYKTYFKFAGGMQPGAAVRYAGLEVGKVERIRVDPENSTRVEFDLAVDRDAPVKKDSLAKISTLGPLAENYIEITPGTQNGKLASPGDILNSAETFGFAQIADAVQEVLPTMKAALAKLDTNLEGLQVTVTRVNDLLNDANRAHVANSLGNVDNMLADAKPKVSESLTTLNGMLADAQPKVSRSLSNVEQLSAKLLPLVDDFKKTAADADAALKHIDELLGENRADIRKSVAQIRVAIEKSTILIDQLNQTLDQNSDNIDSVLDNIRMSTENLRILTDALKTNPSVIIRGMKTEDRRPGGGRK